MIDIKKIEEEARAELAEELGKSARAKVKSKLRDIAMAERVLMGLREEYQVLLRDIGGDVEGIKG